MIETADVVKIFAPYRGDAIVVPGRSGRFWMELSARHDLDVPLGDPAMGGHAAFAFGLALAQPERKVVLFDSDGDVLMGMNILPTIGEHQPRNFYHFMLDNECWATTGGQPVPNAGKVSYESIARAAGYPRAFAFDNPESLALNMERIISEPGPVFVALKVVPEVQNEPIGRRKPWNTRSRLQVLADLRKGLGLLPA